MKPKVIFLLSSLFLIGLTFWMLGQYNSNLHPATLVQKFVYMTSSTDNELENLKEIYLLVNKAHIENTPPSTIVIAKLLEVLQSRDPNIIITNSPLSINKKSNLTSSSEILDVCPEKWFRKIDHPFFQKGYVINNCSNVHPLSEVISIVINFDNTYDCEIHLPNILSGLKKFFPSISVYIPGNIFPTCSFEKSNKNVKSVPVEAIWKPGKIWNQLIAAATTPYVLIGRDLNYFDNFSQVERQIRMISYTSDIIIAGGSIRNLSGHWQVGCYQSKLQNYILEYLNGYYISRNECMFCDHLLGSFVTTKALLQKVPFDNDLPSSVVFEDFFLKVKASRQGSVVNCPDAMYFSTNAYEDKRVNDRLLWLPLAKKRELNRIFLPRDVKHSYSCTEIGISDCKKRIGQTKWFLLPLCCLEQFGRMMKFFHEFCVKNNVFYELEAGSVLGGVKLNGMMPWDLDGDCTFYDANYTLFVNSKKLFKTNGLVLNRFEEPKKGKKNGYFTVNSPDFYIEMWGYHVTSKDLYLPSLFKGVPTKMLIHQTWVYTQVSPGLYARNRYGKEILRHSNSWSQLGMKSSWEPYSPGSFLSCPKPEHHACESHFSADGSLQFYIP